MAILVTGNTYAANDQVTSTNLNAAVNSATFASGAVDNVSTQLGGVSGNSIIVKDSGISPQKLDSTASYTVGSLTVTSAIDTSIITADLLKLAPETGYTTSGTIALNLSVASNARILLADDSVFTVAGQAAGAVNIFALKNNKSPAVSINMTWPAWQTAGGSFPATLTAGQAMVFVLYSYGTSLSDVYAVSSL
jgi:hypothetical protein